MLQRFICISFLLQYFDFKIIHNKTTSLYNNEQNFCNHSWQTIIYLLSIFLKLILMLITGWAPLTSQVTWAKMTKKGIKTSILGLKVNLVARSVSETGHMTNQISNQQKRGAHPVFEKWCNFGGPPGFQAKNVIKGIWEKVLENQVSHSAVVSRWSEVCSSVRRARPVIIII